MLTSFTNRDAIPDCDLCIVGAGPVGIALALSCEQSGLSVLLLESGYDQPDRFTAALTAGHAVGADRHHPANIVMCRGLGGTSRWWGGRCVPFDDIDFMHRPHVPEAAWPIPHYELSRWYEDAAHFFGIGPARFTAAPSSGATFGDATCDQLERWTPEVDAGRRHRSALAKSSLVTVMMGATVTKLHFEEHGHRVTGLTISDATKTERIKPRKVVLACGGLETTRLLLCAQQDRPELFGGQDGPLGRGYMGHVYGKVADVVLADPSAVTEHDFFVDDGAFARRRFTLRSEAQLRHELLNIAFWIDNPAFYQAGHGSGVLSLAWLALAMAPIGRLLVSEGVRVNHVGPTPHRWIRHLANVIRSPLSTLRAIAAILSARYLSTPRRPGFLIKGSDGRYALHYIAEQAPNSESRVGLSNRKDSLGLPYLDIDLRYREVDARSVIKAHEVLDRSLRLAGFGRLEYHAREDELIALILKQAKDGFHQFGTTRMGQKPETSVVDATCRVHGVDNLYLSSSSVFPSSGQANPTFAAVALALRLAAHIADEVRASRLGVAA